MKKLSYAAIIGAMLSATPALAQGPADFWRGTTMRITIGHPPGGSYDFYARMAAEYMKAHIPGNPNMIVENRPGGGGVVATGFFYAQAPRDGSNIALFPETIAHTQMLEPAVGKWKVQEMSYIGSFAPVNTAFVFRKGAPALTPKDFMTVKSNAGCTGRNSQSYQYPAMLKALADFKFDIICGYKGSADSVLALERGEVDFVSSAWNSWRATHKETIARGDMIVVMQGGLKRNAELKDVPLMQELVSDPEAKKVIEFASAGAAIGRALIAPPGIPADRLAALRAAFDKMVADPAFRAEAERRNLEIDPTSGVELQGVVTKILGAEPAIVERATAAIK